MASDVEISNQALGHIGISHEINSLDETSNEAEQAKRYFEPTRDALLRDFDWPFASRYKVLNLVANNPNDDWSYSYRYPSDCLAIRGFVLGKREATTRIPYTVSSDDTGRLIFTDLASAVIRQTTRITNTDLFDPSFVVGFAWRLAFNMAIPLSRSKEERDYALKQYLAWIGTAWTNASNESGQDAPPEAEVIRARE